MWIYRALKEKKLIYTSWSQNKYTKLKEEEQTLRKLGKNLHIFGVKERSHIKIPKVIQNNIKSASGERTLALYKSYDLLWKMTLPFVLSRENQTQKSL